jgi:drug/metabolite transporter (DMT)-like permease
MPSRGALIASGLMTISAMTFACSVCITRRYVRNYGASMMMGVSAIFGSLIALPFAMAHSEPGITGSIAAAAWPLTYVVLAGTLLAYLAYYEGIRRVSAFTASMIFLLKPVMACTLAVFLAGESMNAWTLTGTAVIVGSLCMTLKK